MSIPTEPIGSVPRSRQLQEAMNDFAEGSISPEKIDHLFDEAVQETIIAFAKIEARIRGTKMAASQLGV